MSAVEVDKTMLKEAHEWVEAVMGAPLEGGFPEGLKNGVVLCELINKFKPGSVAKINNSTMPFKKMENVSNFLKAARALGMKEFELFSTVDLTEDKNTQAVVVCITAFGRLMQKLFPAAPYPTLGVKVLDKTERVFSEEQIAKGRAAVSVLNLGSSAHGKMACEEVLEGKKALGSILDGPSPSSGAGALPTAGAGGV